ncbi:MAG: hypothetical protein JWP98_1267, partial [Edaphobacter sp.]|nr:hypothetical protein [Edaphobacter sp.]
KSNSKSNSKSKGNCKIKGNGKIRRSDCDLRVDLANRYAGTARVVRPIWFEVREGVGNE